jgi:glycosyltransferase involved in cell wall biosynthesis
MGPAISVVIPTYNRAPLLPRAIASALAALAQGDEILVVDDGSTDRTPAILQQLRDEDSRIRVVRHDRNRGRPFARNTILREAQGEHLAWLDVDDEWYPAKLEAQFACLAASEQAGLSRVIVMCPFNWRWTHAAQSCPVFPKASDDPLRDFLSGSVGAYLWSMLGRTETFRSVGSFDEKLPRLQDLEFMIRYARSGGAIAVAGNEPLCVYNKSDADKSGRAVAASLARIWALHRPLYLRYGRIFALSCRIRHFSLAARHAYRNEGAVLGSYYKLRVLGLRLARQVAKRLDRQGEA